MDTKTIIGAVIAIVLLSAVVVPIVDTVGTSYSYYDNPEGKWNCSIVDADNITITPGTNAFKINDKEISTTDISGWGVFSDKLSLDIKANGSFNVLDLTGAHAMATTVTSVKFTDGTATVTTSSTSYNVTDNAYVCIPDESGKYTLYSASNQFKVNKDVTLHGIAGMSFSTTVATPAACSFDLTSEGITNLNAVSSNAVGSLTVSGTPTIATYDDNTYSVGQASFTLTQEESTYTTTATPIVAAPNTYKTVTENDSIVNTLVAIIPVLLAVSIVVGIAATALIKKE